MTESQKAERLELIKKVNAKVQRSAVNKSRIRRWINQDEFEAKRNEERQFDAMIEKMDENHNEYTDSAKYAEKYYGETYHETTKLDNEWS